MAANSRVNKTKFFIALLFASSAGALSILLTRGDIGAAVLLLIPGVIVGMMASGNVHVFQTWVLVVGNAVFYFGCVYLAWAIRDRWTKRTGRNE